MNPPPKAGARRPGPTAPSTLWWESLPFFAGGAVALGLAGYLLLVHSPAALARLPLWTFLVAIGSIALVGGTVATFVADPIPDLPVENELVGEDLIVVSRARWKDLTKMERWVEERLATPPEETSNPVPRGPARSPTVLRAAPPLRRRPRTGLRAPPDPSVPTLDDLLADLRLDGLPPAAPPPWSEAEDAREVPPPRQPSLRPLTVRPAASVRAEPGAPAPRPRPPRVAPTAPPADLDRLLAELETAASRAVEDREIESKLAPTGALECAGCGRGIGLTDRWEHCDGCLSAYCTACADRIVPVGDRALCDRCRSRRRSRGR